MGDDVADVTAEPQGAQHLSLFSNSNLQILTDCNPWGRRVAWPVRNYKVEAMWADVRSKLRDVGSSS